MNVSVFGLGYVGCVTVGCLSKMGHNIIGVDTNTEKLKIINKGKSTVVEKGLNNLIHDGVKRKLISTSSDPNFANG